MEAAEVKKKRKTRTDKGVIRATRRDMACIAWIAEQYAARGDQIQVILSWYPDPDHPMKDELVSQSTTREQIGRWVRAGWVVYKRMLAEGPGWAYVTRAGLHLVNLDGIFKPHPPSEKMLSHIYAVNQVRLWMDEDEMDKDEDMEYHWKSERRFRTELNVKRGESSGPIADGLVYPNGDPVAVEVQISPLKPSGWVNKFRELLRHRDEGKDGLGSELRYPEIWVYVPSEQMKAAAFNARGSLGADDQARIDVIVQDDLLMEECSWL